LGDGLTADKKLSPGEAGRVSKTKVNGRRKDPLVADALRNAYDETVSENVPQEFLDLLGKLN
jgi:hypothetical protein